MPLLAETATEGYALAEPAPAQHAPAEPGAERGNELVPGTVVLKAGQYKCTACHKARITHGKSETRTAAQAVLKHFKAGKVFTECPHCGELTEWQFVKG